MRKFMLSAFVALLTVTTAFAQTGEKALKEAEKSLSSYTTSNDAMDLQKSIDYLETAMESPEVQSDYEAYIEAGDIYSAAANAYVQQRVLATSTGGEVPAPVVEGAAAKAVDAYIKAWDMSVAAHKKGKGDKDALKGLAAIQGNVSNEGIYAIQDKNYKQSYASFMANLKAHDFLTKQGEASMLDEDNKVNDERYYAGLSAVLNEDFDAAEPLFIVLYEAEYDDAGIYDGLYKVYDGKGDLESAGRYLSEGREKYPEETSLLFTEINYYLAQGKLDDLTDKLELAIKAEPNNVSLYSTLGSVYDQLYQTNKGENPEKAAEYFELAKKNYEAGLKVDEDNASVIYSLGALYFNRAAAMTEELVELGNDLTKEGQKKYEAMLGQIDGEFDQAFPYFKKAEMTDPNNRNTLIALKEIFARRDNYDASNEMKARLETIENGGQIEKSYFAEKGM